MSISSRDFYEYGIAAAQEINSEVAWRNAASRIYYAAFHAANEMVVHCPDNSHLGGMGSHERLSERFKSVGTNGARSIAYVLEAMKKVRHLADYDLKSGFEQVHALSQASQFKALEDRLVSFSQNVQSKSQV